ncbi:MAG TPA: hypothetical protein VN643_15695 [Pyrinomonadaceae bacterium]|nr:hypothetical protein [Pyrinomonadaceae bacterium]
MRQNRRFSGISLLAPFAASVLLLPVFGSAVANGQRRVADDSEVFKAQRQVRQTGTPITADSQKGIGTTRRLPGSGVSGGAKTDSVISISSVTAAPISSCTSNASPPNSHTCNIYETDASGSPSEISNVINLPNTVSNGYVVLKENGAIADSDVTNWSDVLKFGDGNSNNNGTTMQLFSKGCNTANPNDTSCFPPYSPADSAFIVESDPGPTVYSGPPNTYNIFSVDDSAPTRPWSTAGSAGQQDEDSSGIVRYNSFGVNVANGQTGSVHTRYNITAVEGISRLCPATLSVIRTRFRNSDPTGTNAKLTYEIRTSTIGGGGNTVIYTFDSNNRGGGNSFRTVTDTQQIDFNFATNMYWIEATMFRSDPNAFSDLGTIQIWEAAGTACP